MVYLVEWNGLLSRVKSFTLSCEKSLLWSSVFLQLSRVYCTISRVKMLTQSYEFLHSLEWNGLLSPVKKFYSVECILALSWVRIV